MESGRNPQHGTHYSANVEILVRTNIDHLADTTHCVCVLGLRSSERLISHDMCHKHIIIFIILLHSEGATGYSHSECTFYQHSNLLVITQLEVVRVAR